MPGKQAKAKKSTHRKSSQATVIRKTIIDNTPEVQDDPNAYWEIKVSGKHGKKCGIRPTDLHQII